MANKKTSQLIDVLTTDLSPVQLISSDKKLMVLTTAVVLVWFSFLVVVLRPLRGDYLGLLHNPFFQIETLLALLIGLLSLACVVALRRPEKNLHTKSFMGIFLIFISLFVFLVLSSTPYHSLSLVERIEESHCILLLILFASVPTGFLFWQLKKGASTHPKKLTVMTLLATLSASFILLRSVCAVDEIAHQIIAHFAPLILIPLVGFWLGRKVFRL